MCVMVSGNRAVELQQRTFNLFYEIFQSAGGRGKIVPLSVFAIDGPRTVVNI